MNAKEVEKLLDSARPLVVEQLKKEMAQAIGYQAREETAALVKECVAAWVKENILPEVVKGLFENKDALISMGAKLGPAIIDEIIKGLILSVAENMKTSWDRKKIWEALVD